jgi:hypothetical protein
MVWGRPQSKQKIWYEKQSKKQKDWDVAQVVELLPSKHKAPVPQNNNKNNKELLVACMSVQSLDNNSQKILQKCISE